MTAPTELRSATASRRDRQGSRRPQSSATFVSVLGELLLTGGAVVLLFVAWQMWIGDIIIGAESNKEGAAITAEWRSAPAPEPPQAVVPEGAAEPVWVPPVGKRPEGTEVFAVMHVPRFGADYQVPIAGGTTRPLTLDKGYIGYYDQADALGEPGNFAVAGHRTTWGAPLNKIDRLHVNDAIVVETPDGWYTYRFRTLQYVTPDQVDVLLDVPQVPGAVTGESFITLTACSPLYSLAERIVAYGVFEGFQPISEGPPTSLSEGAS